MSLEDLQIDLLLSEAEKKEMLEWLGRQDLGIKFLRYMCHELCTYNINSGFLQGGGLAPYEVMTFHESKKHIWQEIRRYIPHQKLQEIESHDKYLFEQQQQLVEQYERKMKELEEHVG